MLNLKKKLSPEEVDDMFQEDEIVSFLVSAGILVPTVSEIDVNFIENDGNVSVTQKGFVVEPRLMTVVKNSSTANYDNELSSTKYNPEFVGYTGDVLASFGKAG